MGARRVDSVTFSATGINPRYGWTVGVGGEYLFTPWLSGFVEYDYYGFSNRNFTFFTDTAHSIRENKNVVKAGLNFRFSNWWVGTENQCLANRGGGAWPLLS